MVQLDNVDRGILHELQLDARNRTAQEIADGVDVSASTVRNRIEQLEAVGTGTADTVRITDAIHDMGLSIERSEILSQRRVQPFNHFFFTDPYENEHGDDWER